MLYCFHLVFIVLPPLKKRPVVMGNFPRIRPKPFLRLLWIEECLDNENLMRMTSSTSYDNIVWQHVRYKSSFHISWLYSSTFGLSAMASSSSRAPWIKNRPNEQLPCAFQMSMCFWWAAATFTGKSFDLRANSHHSIWTILNTSCIQGHTSPTTRALTICIQQKTVHCFIQRQCSTTWHNRYHNS